MRRTESESVSFCGCTDNSLCPDATQGQAVTSKQRAAASRLSYTPTKNESTGGRAVNKSGGGWVDEHKYTFFYLVFLRHIICDTVLVKELKDNKHLNIKTTLNDPLWLYDV